MNGLIQYKDQRAGINAVTVQGGDVDKINSERSHYDKLKVLQLVVYQGSQYVVVIFREDDFFDIP